MAEVGKLKVRLIGDNDRLNKAVRKSENRLKSFAASVRRVIGTKLVGAFKDAGAAMGAALGGAVLGLRQVINEMDKLTKLSRSIGVPVEELSKLQFAAELSGVKVEELGRGLRNFARNAQAASRGPTDFSRSLDALGIKWKDTEGQFRSADEVMDDVADKFAKMEDSSNKTALAMKIFGEEVGPRFVSLLNSGSDGIAKMKAEAERLGISFDSQAGKAAEQFNDTITRVQSVLGGLFNRLAIDLLPSLQDAATRMLEWAKSSSTLQHIITGLGASIKVLISVVKAVIGAFENMRLLVVGTFEAIANAATLNFTKAGEVMARTVAQMAENTGDTVLSIRDTWIAAFKDQKDAAATFSEETVPLVVEGTGQVKAATDAYNRALEEGRALKESLRTPEEAMIARQARINELMKAGAIDAQTYGRAMAQASAFSADNINALAGTVSSALGTIFKDSKGAAIAQAVINTAQGITKAIATYPPPISTAMAAIQAAAGAAQIATIKSTTQSGGGGGTPASSAGTGTAAASQAASTSGGGGSQQTLFVDGINSDQLFTGDVVRGLAQRLIDYQRDGGRVVLGGA